MRLLSITVAVAFSVYANVAPAVNTGVSLTPTSVIVLFAKLEDNDELSVTCQAIVRDPKRLLGSSLLE